MVDMPQGTAATPSLKAASFVAAICLAAGALVIATLLVLSSLTRPAPSAGSAQADPILSNAAIEFRASEQRGHADPNTELHDVIGQPAFGTDIPDPVLTDDAIEFRAGERVGASTAGTSLARLTQREIDFRAAVLAAGR